MRADEIAVEPVPSPGHVGRYLPGGMHPGERGDRDEWITDFAAGVLDLLIRSSDIAAAPALSCRWYDNIGKYWRRGAHDAISGSANRLSSAIRAEHPYEPAGAGGGASGALSVMRSMTSTASETFSNRMPFGQSRHSIHQGRPIPNLEQPGSSGVRLGVRGGMAIGIATDVLFG
jgi:hypothetical protein